MTIQDISDKTGTPVRTIRFYITEGLLAGPQGRGTATSYTEDHLQRLVLIRQLARQRVPLAEVREKLQKVFPEDLAEVIAEEKRRGKLEEKARTGSPREYLSALLERAHQGTAEPASHRRMEDRPSAGGRAGGDIWRRVKVTAEIELHFTMEAEQRDGEAIGQILDLARQAVQRTIVQRTKERKST